ncbi:phosphoribosyltransferase family protein [Isoptericola halotolerans]|uniref:ComF family protein n=1 Tax=Isoptericola halotolerans TaxID=300560 RepID=UPI00388F7EA7
MLVRLARLVVPVSCPGCGAYDVRCCSACAAVTAGGPVRRVEHGAPRLDRLEEGGPLPVWAVGDYAGPVRDVVVAWKDRERADLDGLLAAALRRAGTTVAPAVRTAAGRAPVAVVPAPSAPGARLRRGREPVAVLARALVDGLGARSVPADVVPALRRRRATRDQVGLGVRARGRNLAASLAVRRNALSPGTPCVLVDDVLTTGATLAAAEQALTDAGAVVLGASVLAATPPPDAVTESPHTGSTPAVHPADTLGLV